MTLLALIRHAPTEWNEQARLQGRADPGLSAAGWARAAGWRVPDRLQGFGWQVSPLMRARQTAAALGVTAVIEPALIEMDWAAWEGRRLADLRAADPRAMAAIEARGLDFEPPGGESPRMVQARLRPWLARIAEGGEPVAAITHKGVIRAILALAADWDMLGRPPLKLALGTVDLFTLRPDGTPAWPPERLGLEP